MKKSMSIILLVILLFLSLQSMAIAEEVSQQEETEVKQQETVNEYAKYIEFVKKLDIMPEQAFEGNLYMTRGEFADYVNNILFSGNSAAEAQAWIAEVFREDNVDELIITSTVTDSFSDVSQNHAYYNEIEKVKQFLIMTGTGNGTFSPDKIITFGEVGIAMVRLLGYGIQAQRTSYEATAFVLGIFNGLSYNQSQNITKNELARVFYNCADVELMKADIKTGRIEYSVSEENMLEKFLDVYKDKGQIITNSFTSIYGTDGLGKNKVLINNVIYNIDNAEYLNDYIGREVEYYYFDNGEVELPQIMIAETTNKDETVCIPAEDIVEFKNYKFVYENGRRTVTKTVKPGAALIYNGINMGNYTPDMFDFETGDVTLIKSRHSSQIDIIVVNSYTSYYIAELNRNDMILFGKTTADADAKSFDTLADTAEEYKVRVYWQNGGKASLNELSRGMVCDIAQNGKCIKIIIPTDNIYAVTVTGVGERDGNHSLRDTENRSFEFLQSYYDTLGYKKPVIGESYTIYLNSFGKIVWIDVGQSEKNSDIHYLISTADDEDENGAYVKLLNSNGVISRYHVVLNTKVKNQENEAIKFKSGMSLEAILDSYSGVVRVKFNEENEVTEIELPQKRETTERSGRLGAFEENEKVYWCGQGTEKHFENVMLSSKAVLFRINEAATEDSDKYSIITQNILKSGNTYSIKAYNYDSESIVSDCVVIKGGLALPIDDNNKTMYIIKSINEALNDEDESVIEIECTGIAANAKPVEARLRLKSGTTAHAETFFDPNAKILLKKGDIVYCEIENDYVTRIALIYRIYNEVGESNLYGTSGAYTPTLSNATNPYVVSSTGTIDTNVNNVTKLRPALTRFFAGYVYKLEQDKYLTYTSMPLNSGTMFDRKNLDSKYLAETVILPKNYVVVDVYGDKMEIQNGDVGAIKTYYNSGTARSEVFILTRYGVPWQLVFVNRR